MIFCVCRDSNGRETERCREKEREREGEREREEKLEGERKRGREIVNRYSLLGGVSQTLLIDMEIDTDTKHIPNTNKIMPRMRKGGGGGGGGGYNDAVMKPRKSSNNLTYSLSVSSHTGPKARCELTRARRLSAEQTDSVAWQEIVA
eukprot:sb/3473748/